MIERLQTEFIPAVGNTHELQNQKSAAGDWFMTMARKVNQRVNNGVTAQGFYVTAPDGSAYGFNNNRSLDRVNGFMDKGLAEYKAKPPTPVEIPAEQVKAAYWRVPGESTSVLRVFSKIDPLPADANPLNKGVGRDHLWVFPDEVQQMRFGKTPPNFIARLVRYHLVDNVRGEPDFWSAEEVKKASLQVKKVAENRFVITGSVACGTANGARGLEGNVDGQFTIDPIKDKITSFKAFVEGTAWGAGQWTPGPPPGKFPLKFAIVNTDDEISKVVPPQAGQYPGSEYAKPAWPSVLKG